jgi:hypothetical protein
MIQFLLIFVYNPQNMMYLILLKRIFSDFLFGKHMRLSYIRAYADYVWTYI